MYLHLINICIIRALIQIELLSAFKYFVGELTFAISDNERPDSRSIPLRYLIPQHSPKGS